MLNRIPLLPRSVSNQTNAAWEEQRASIEASRPCQPMIG